MTPNDSGPRPPRPERLPELPGADGCPIGAGVTISGSLNSRPTRVPHRVLRQLQGRPLGLRPGAEFLGATSVGTDDTGNGTFTAVLSLPAAGLVGSVFSATAINQSGNVWSGDTSEFSADVNPFVVTNTNDSGVGSLRQVLTDAEAVTGFVPTITFNIPGSGVQTITLASALPTITTSVNIDAYTQPGSPTKPIVVVVGAGAGANANGFDIELGQGSGGPFATGAAIEGLVINGFDTNGVLIGTTQTGRTRGRSTTPSPARLHRHRRQRHEGSSPTASTASSSMASIATTPAPRPPTTSSAAT